MDKMLRQINLLHILTTHFTNIHFIRNPQVIKDTFPASHKSLKQFEVAQLG
jgi:hypothetical protein